MKRLGTIELCDESDESDESVSRRSQRTHVMSSTSRCRRHGRQTTELGHRSWVLCLLRGCAGSPLLGKAITRYLERCRIKVTLVSLTEPLDHPKSAPPGGRHRIYRLPHHALAELMIGPTRRTAIACDRTSEQRARLVEIAEMCIVHRTHRRDADLQATRRSTLPRSLVIKTNVGLATNPGVRKPGLPTHDCPQGRRLCL